MATGPAIYTIQTSDASQHTGKLQEILQNLKTANRIVDFTLLDSDENLSAIAENIEEEDMVLIVLTHQLESKKKHIESIFRNLKSNKPGTRVAEVIVDNVVYDNEFITFPADLRPIRDRDDMDVVWNGIEQNLKDMYPVKKIEKPVPQKNWSKYLKITGIFVLVVLTFFILRGFTNDLYDLFMFLFKILGIVVTVGVFRRKHRQIGHHLAMGFEYIGTRHRVIVGILFGSVTYQMLNYHIADLPFDVTAGRGMSSPNLIDIMFSYWSIWVAGLVLCVPAFTWVVRSALALFDKLLVGLMLSLFFIISLLLGVVYPLGSHPFIFTWWVIPLLLPSIALAWLFRHLLVSKTSTIVVIGLAIVAFAEFIANATTGSPRFDEVIILVTLFALGLVAIMRLWHGSKPDISKST